MGIWLEETTFIHGQLYVAAFRVGDPQNLHFAVKKSDRRKTRNIVYMEILLICKVVSTLTEVPLLCSLLNSDQPRGGAEEYCCITPLHFLYFDVISVTTRKTQSYARKKELLGKVSLSFHHQSIVNNLLAWST